MQITLQLGKNGLTQEFLEDIKSRFENIKIKNIKISVLPSAREKKGDVRIFAEQIKEFLGAKYTYRILGFSIFVKKWRKEKG